jgi:hypothetical protein
VPGIYDRARFYLVLLAAPSLRYAFQNKSNKEKKMSEVELYAPFLGYSGAIGKIVYRKYKGRIIAAQNPVPSGR